MVIAVTGYAFNDHIENGGDGLKIGLVRVQAAKVAKNSSNSVCDASACLTYLLHEASPM